MIGKLMRSTIRTLVGAALVVGLASVGSPVGAQTALKKLKFGLGTPVMNLTYPWASMPVALGYWSQAGYDVEVFAAQSSLQSIQQLNAGNLDFAEVNSAPIVQAVAGNNIPVRTVMVNTVIDWSLVALDASPIRDVKDFKGKTIGVSTLGTGGVALLNSFLSARGLKPNDDFALVAVGVGPAAVEALRSNRVQGLMYWGSAITSFEVTGLKLRYFFDPEWRHYPDFSMVTMQSTIERDPKMVEAIVRGAVMGSLFATTNPDCVRRIQWAKFPATKPTGADEAQLAAADLHRLEGQLQGMKQALEMGGGKLWGNVTAKDFARTEQLLVDTRVITKGVANPADYVVSTPGFFEKVNTFDHEAVIRQAQECKLP
jgi:NitT/TauT family transport system substrate-binding protein